MRNTRALAIAAANFESRPLPQDIAENTFVELFKPLPFLLVSGGDARLMIDPIDKSNAYGCRSCPTPQTLAFSSSTATSISERAYWRAHQAREELIQESIQRDFLDAFDARIERMRYSLASHLKLDRTDVVFSPSGTDSQLHAIFFVRQLLGGPLASIVVGADQTGSGTAHTARGRHFSDRTAQGKSVVKGRAIIAPDHDKTSISISLFCEDGAIRSESEVDAAVIEAVAQQIQMGRKVILQTVDSSKLGWRAPSDACLRDVSARWPQVQIVVDACQMRIGRPRLREYLNRGYIVLLTGSKFFAGPAFSGASLWPQVLSTRIAAMDATPRGLAEYATRFDLPSSWSSVRTGLPHAPNFGQWLRWEAALEEMGAYYTLPDSWRRVAFARLADAVAAAIASSQNLEFVAARGGDTSAFDDDMPATIFSFFVKRGSRTLDFDEMTKIYRALNRDLSASLPDTATNSERALASVSCHLGQPVKLATGTVLRINIGARILSQAWSDDEHAADSNLHTIVCQIATIVKKIELILATNAHIERPT